MIGRLPGDSIETVVIGGGQAGLATGYHLKRLGLDHVILDENEQVGAAWRNRWESLRLFTPGRYNNLPGMPYPGPPSSLPAKDDIADYLQKYVARFELPVRTGVKVDRVAADGDGYLVDAGDERIWAKNVVVATGAFHTPRIPDFADSLNPNIVQLHSFEYRGPSQVQEGSVLVVGAGQSGVEIALDMSRDHRVWLSGKDHGEEPGRPGSITDRLITPIMVFAATKVINVANPIGRKVRAHFLYPPRGIPRAGGTRKKVPRRRDRMGGPDDRDERRPSGVGRRPSSGCGQYHLVHRLRPRLRLDRATGLRQLRLSDPRSGRGSLPSRALLHGSTFPAHVELSPDHGHGQGRGAHRQAHRCTAGLSHVAGRDARENGQSEPLV